MSSYLTPGRFFDNDPTDREWTAEEHRVQARRLLSRANGNGAENYLRAALVHATLAESLANHSHPHTHGPVR